MSKLHLSAIGVEKRRTLDLGVGVIHLPERLGQSTHSLAVTALQHLEFDLVLHDYEVAFRLRWGS